MKNQIHAYAYSNNRLHRSQLGRNFKILNVVLAIIMVAVLCGLFMRATEHWDRVDSNNLTINR